jgi:hypothetical protein
MRRGEAACEAKILGFVGAGIAIRVIRYMIVIGARRRSRSPRNTTRASSIKTEVFGSGIQFRPAKSDSSARTINRHKASNGVSPLNADPMHHEVRFPPSYRKRRQ